MKKQTKRWIAAVLSMALLVIGLYVDMGVTANAANATKVSIANLPEDGVLFLNEESSYGQYDFDSTKISGVLYWEVKKGTTTGVQSSYTGKVYPVKSGEFEIRVLAFRTRANRTKWLNARKANGYVADPKAEKYVKAASDWTTITVKGEEGLAVAGTQSRLNKLLKDKNVKNIVIFTNAERNFLIGNKSYKSKTLTVNAPNSDVDNQGRFAAINVAQIKDSTFRERAKGNRFHVTAPNARIVVEKGARIGAVSFQPDMKKDPDAKLNLEVNGTLTDLTIVPVNHEKGAKQAVVTVDTAENANVSDVKVEESAILEIRGKNTSKTKVTVEESAEGTVINAETPIAADLKASVELKLDKGATKSVLTLLKVITAVICSGENGSAEDVTIKMEKEAEGAKLETTAKVEIQTEVKVEITLGEGAEGSTIVADSEVAKEIKVENQTKEDVVIKNENGDVTTTVGAGSDVQVTPVPTDAPSTGTTTPGAGTNPPSTGTPNPTVTPVPDFKVGKVTYILDNRGEEKEITIRVNENPDIDPNFKMDAYYVGEITVPQGTRIIQLKVEEKEPYGRVRTFRYFGFDPETGMVSGITKDTKAQYALWSWSKFEEGKEQSRVEVLINVKVGEDKVTPSGTPKPGELTRVWYFDQVAGKQVDVEFRATENALIYEAEIPVSEGQSIFSVYAEGPSYNYSWADIGPTFAGTVVLYPINPDENTVLIVNLIAKKQDSQPTVGELGTITYKVNGEGSSAAVTPAVTPDAEGKCTVSVNIERDDISAINSLVFEIAAVEGYQAVTGAAVTLTGEGDSKTGTKTVTVSPVDAEKYQALTVIFNVTVNKTGTSKEPIPAYTGSVCYKVGDSSEKSITEFTGNKAEITLEANEIGEIVISIPAPTDNSPYVISEMKFQKGETTANNMTIAAGETVTVTVTIIATDETKNPATYTITFKAPLSQPEEETLTVTINPAPAMTVGTAIVVTGSAVDSEAAKAAPEPSEIIEVTVSSESAATATATVKFKEGYTKDNFSEGTVKITFTAAAKKGDQEVTDNITYTWKQNGQALSEKTGTTCEVEVDLTQLDTQTISVTVAENN